MHVQFVSTANGWRRQTNIVVCVHVVISTVSFSHARVRSLVRQFGCSNVAHLRRNQIRNWASWKRNESEQTHTHVGRLSHHMCLTDDTKQKTATSQEYKRPQLLTYEIIKDVFSLNRSFSGRTQQFFIENKTNRLILSSRLLFLLSIAFKHLILGGKKN